MSNRYKGGVISATPPTTTGGEDGTASGAWTLEQQMQLQAAGLWPSQPPPLYIENVFSVWLYTGTGAAQTITNGINLSGKGGMVWFKDRTVGNSNRLFDTVRGASSVLTSNTTGAAFSSANMVTSFNTTGFSLGTDTSGGVNDNGDSFVSWTFREQPKFFDVVTYNGTGVDMAVNHNLQAQPGCVIIKRINGVTDWNVMFPGLISDGYGGTGRMSLNKTDAYSATGWTSVANSTQITIPTNTPAINEVGGTYIAYLFASNAGGFGLTESENAITCGTYTGNGSTTGPIITLGYEPQWLMIKRTNSTGSWYIFDNMRGLRNSGGVWLVANTFDAEDTSVNIISSLATGFQPVQTGTATNGGGDTYIYIAIRRGPMAVPTSGTSVFYPTTYTGTGVARTFSGFGFPPDFEFSFSRGGSAAGDGNGSEIYDKLRGTQVRLLIPSTGAETSGTEPVTMIQDGISVGATANSYINASGFAKVLYALRRAPSYFDEVCYTGTGSSATSFSHNLGVPPELIISKIRSAAGPNWIVTTKFATTNYMVLPLNLTNSGFTTGYADGGSIEAKPTSTVIRFTGGISAVNDSGSTYVAYLFATCAGVSKVGSYTGNGSTQTIDCGFGAGGARFVIIKRTDSTGDWYVYDTSRGMTVLTDPYFFINSTAAEVATLGSVTTVSTGFALNATILAAINTNGASYIFLAIA